MTVKDEDGDGGVREGVRPVHGKEANVLRLNLINFPDFHGDVQVSLSSNDVMSNVVEV